MAPALEGAYELGRGEARQGDPMDALLSAYRVGARVAWRELSSTAVDGGFPPLMIARFAELVFAFIDELSAASVSGHADELASSDRERRRHLDRLARTSSPGRPPRRCRQVPTVPAGSHRTPSPRFCFRRRRPAGWCPARGVHTALSDDLPGIDSSESVVVLLVATCTGPTDPGYCETARPPGIVGPARTWTQAQLVVSPGPAGPTTRSPAIPRTIDTDAHLVELVLGADREAADDLRRLVLAPLDQLRPNTAERLAETLRSWLLHQGQRDAVAADLFVHAQTVRYRMTQLRELFGERLNDPQTVLELIVALGIPRPVGVAVQSSGGTGP